MLVYHPAFDIHHCVFRMARLLNRLPMSSYQVERMRILDFYLLFPGQIPSFHFPRSMLAQKKTFAAKDNRYEKLTDPYRIFFQLAPFQKEALGYLAARGLIDPGQLTEDMVAKTDNPLPTRLSATVEETDRLAPDAIELLTGPWMKIDLYGKDGLKARSDLFEYRYDPIPTIS